MGCSSSVTFVHDYTTRLPWRVGVVVELTEGFAEKSFLAQLIPHHSLRLPAELSSVTSQVLEDGIRSRSELRIARDWQTH